VPRHRDQFYEPRLGDEVDWPFVPGEARFLRGRDGRFAPLRRCLILFGCTSSCFSVRAEVSTAPRVIAGRNPPAPHTTPRRTRGAFALTDLTLRIQQTLEALDIFRAVAGLPIIRVTEMLHPSTFLEVRVSCSTIVRIFLHKTVAGQGDGRLKSKGVVRCVNRREMKYLTRRRTRNGSQS
jgi:hypothetical protein